MKFLGSLMSGNFPLLQDFLENHSGKSRGWRNVLYFSDQNEIKIKTMATKRWKNKCEDIIPETKSMDS